MKPSLDAPDDQTLTPPAITSSKDTLNARRIFLSGDNDSFNQRIFPQPQR